MRTGSIDNRNLETRHLKWLGSRSKCDFKLFVDNKNWRFVNRFRPSLLKTIYHSLFKYINENRVIRITLVIENIGKSIFTLILFYPVILPLITVV